LSRLISVDDMAPPFIATKRIRADARRNRERILAAARECFGKDGVEAQIDDVAACAGVGVGTVYRHFATKDALIAALAADYFAGQTAVAEQALQIDDPWQAFSTFLRNGAGLMAENRALAQLSADRPDIMGAAAADADREFGFFGKCEGLITQAQQAGELRDDLQLEDIPAIVCALGSLQISKGPQANWRRVLEIVLDGLHCREPSALPPVHALLPRTPG
jgi:AcrR family transcriptional regulator